jgi:hypothetical protein
MLGQGAKVRVLVRQAALGGAGRVAARLGWAVRGGCLGVFMHGQGCQQKCVRALVQDTSWLHACCWCNCSCTVCR